VETLPKGLIGPQRVSRSVETHSGFPEPTVVEPDRAGKTELATFQA
jgi:hypothetical protein